MCIKPTFQLEEDILPIAISIEKNDIPRADHFEDDGEGIPIKYRESLEDAVDVFIIFTDGQGMGAIATELRLAVVGRLMTRRTHPAATEAPQGRFQGNFKEYGDILPPHALQEVRQAVKLGNRSRHPIKQKRRARLRLLDFFSKKGKDYLIGHQLTGAHKKGDILLGGRLFSQYLTDTDTCILARTHQLFCLGSLSRTLYAKQNNVH